MSESLAVRSATESEPLSPKASLPVSFPEALAFSPVRDVLDLFAQRDLAGETLTAVRHFPAREAQWADFPAWVRADLRAAYLSKGIRRPYTHQAAAAEAVHSGKNVVVVTPTASGKTLCYNLPVLNEILEKPDTRALYLFPTKALAQDQLAELHDLNTSLDDCFGVFTYDGDTPADARKAIREKSHIVLTNPDMLHTGILPHHTKWTRLFENLRYIVIDELHTYRGVFGSHLCNVLRRLKRIANFYGRDPQFVCCSATIGNPGELATRLLEAEVEVLNANGAPAAHKTFVFYNPPVVNRALGIRRSYINESSRVAQEFLKREMQTMVFANSRLHTELLLTYLQQANPQRLGKPDTIRGYRGGYLPGERREIERRLRDGRIRGVVATSAMELGIDVGSLDIVVMAGYPGTIAATWQRAGRAGRRSGSSCAVLVASSAPLDQFIIRHPDYFFGNSPEQAFIQPDNLELLLNHLKCAAFELPITPEEKFGDVDLPDLCARLSGAGYLHRAGENYHWTHEAYPADTISLRSVTSDNFVIIDITGVPKVIGEVDFPSALTSVHEKAIYMHGGTQFHVDHLDFKERKAYVKKVDVDYYTDAIRYTQVRILETAVTAHANAAWLLAGEQHAAPHPGTVATSSIVPLSEASSHSHGDVLVRSQVIGFKKIKLFTNENIGAGQLQLPENEMHTTSYWITLKRPLLDSLSFTVSERQSGMFGLLHALESVATLLLMCDCRDLGTAIGERPPAPYTGDDSAQGNGGVLETGAACRAVPEPGSRFALGVPTSHLESGSPAPALHEAGRTPQRAASTEITSAEEFTPTRIQDAIGGSAKEFFEPNLYLYDAYPGGIGFSEPLFRVHQLLVRKTRELISACPCNAGCPSCVGPAGDLAPRAKEAALAILDRLCN
ncbi:MAG: DEAD/DEAH box helicase [Candidatus Acidiferrum sp.]|jgi:DEAD/DEAH box helicase domain-containing protein